MVFLSMMDSLKTKVNTRYHLLFSNRQSNNKYTTVLYSNHHRPSNDDRIEIPANDVKRKYQRVHRIMQNTAIILNTFLVSSVVAVQASEMAPTTSSIQSSQKITNVAYLDIKIANYTEESVGTNMGALGSGRIVIGLFGDDAPFSTQRFLETIQSDGDKLPTFLNSQFSKVTDNCLLQLDDMPRLEVVNIAGTEQFQYGGEILTNYKPILDTNSIRHDRYVYTLYVSFYHHYFLVLIMVMIRTYRRGLLTRRQLTTGPEFGITLGPAPFLDGFHVVFGVVLEGLEVLLLYYYYYYYYYCC